MSASFIVTLPYPPSTNRLWRQARKRVIRSPEYEAWLSAASWIVKARLRYSSGQVGVPGPYELHVRLCPPDRRLRDLDNVLKAISDALKHGGAIAGDHLCQRIEAEWDALIEGASVTVVETKLRMPAVVKSRRRAK